MISTCPVCAQKVIIKNGVCPHCRNTFDFTEMKRVTPQSNMKMPIRIVFAIANYAALVCIFAGIAFQFEFDIISFFLILASIFSILGIVSLVLRRSWARRFNIALQVVLFLFMLSLSAFLITTAFLSGPGVIISLIVMLFEGWVLLGFLWNKEVFEYLES